MTITLPYPPSTNNLYIQRGKIRVKSARCRQYHSDVAALFPGDEAPLTGELVATVHIYRPRKIGDLDNMKAIWDSLKGLAYVDDGQIVEIHAYRHDDKTNPRAVVTVERWTL